MRRGYRTFSIDLEPMLRYERRLKKLAKHRGWLHWTLTMRSNGTGFAVYLTVHTPRNDAEAAIGYPSLAGKAGKI